MEKKYWRWGILGCGAVTEVKSGPAYSLVPEFELFGAMRRDLEKARDYATRHRLPFYTNDAKALIEHPKIDAIYIATPPDTHKSYGLLVAAAGKPCCIEKPLAPNYADALAIQKAFEVRGLPLFVAYYRRSLPRFLKVKSWLDAGHIGAIRHIHWEKTRTPSPMDISGAYNWRTDQQVAYGGYFDDLASHGLDLFVFLLGAIERASGLSRNQQGYYTSMDAVTGSWLHKGGVTGSGYWNFGVDAGKDRVTILGKKGRISFSVLDDAPIRLVSEAISEELYIAHPAHVQQFHVAGMAAELKGGARHPSTGKTAVHTNWVMDRILGIPVP